MKKIFLFLAVCFLTFGSTQLWADPGKGKPSEFAGDPPPPTLPPVVVEKTKRVCGWTDGAFTYSEEATNYNTVVFSVGSGVGGGYNRTPAQKNVSVSTYSCSPRSFDEVAPSHEVTGEENGQP